MKIGAGHDFSLNNCLIHNIKYLNRIPDIEKEGNEEVRVKVFISYRRESNESKMNYDIECTALSAQLSGTQN